MNIGEIGFVIQKDDGSYVLQPGGRRSRRKSKPWTTWAAADKFNRSVGRLFVNGALTTTLESAPKGKVVMVRLVPVEVA